MFLLIMLTGRSIQNFNTIWIEFTGELAGMSAPEYRESGSATTSTLPDHEV